MARHDFAKSHMQKSIVWVLGVIIIVAGWFLFTTKGTTQAPSENSETSAQESIDADTGAGSTGESSVTAAAGTGTGAGATVATNVPTTVITYTDAGFVPSSVAIKKGQTVRWENNSGSKVWPASAVHPTHSVYPQKSASDCLGSTFDACKGLQKGESWDFTFNNVGEWRFHDHLHAYNTGSVTVTE